MRPTQQHCKELFTVVKRKLHWKIGDTHSAPASEFVNVDGQVWPRDVLQSILTSNRMPANKDLKVDVSFNRIPESLKEAA